MKIANNARWIGALIVGSLALVGMNASATSRTIAAFAQVHAGSTCSPPTGTVYAMEAQGTGSGTIWCNAYMPAAGGLTALSHCASGTPSGLNLRGALGSLNTTSYDFTPGTGSAVATPATWNAGHNVDLAPVQWAPAAGCIVDGISQGRN